MTDEARHTYVAGSVVNSYAQVTAISTTSITLSATNRIDGGNVQFTAGEEIFVHVSASINGDKEYLGKWTFAEITSVSGNVLTLDRNITGDIPAATLQKYYVQALTVPFFYGTTTAEPVRNTIAPPAYDVTKYCGGILVLKAQTWAMGSGTVSDYGINLRDRGIPVTHKNLRPWFAYEQEGILDTDSYAGWENAMLEHRLPLNAGDGAALIYTSAAGSFGYIEYVGNPVSKGVRFCRGASDSPNLPANVTNIGGSTVLMIGRGRSANILSDWAAKYRSTSSEQGQGLGARMFVTANINGNNYNEGGLYSHMRTHHDLPSNLKIVGGFGDGSFGSVTDIAVAKKQMNNYALITTTSTNATYNTKKINYARKTTTGLAPIQAGALVMVQIFNTLNWTTADTVICHILDDNGTTFTLDKTVNLGANRQAMVVSIPQFKNFTLDGTNEATPKYSNGIGGIFAIACSGTCNLSAGKIGVGAKGGVPINTTDPTLIERYDRLTLGAGNGSILILANAITMSTDTRIGSAAEGNSGNKLGGRGFNGTVSNGVATLSLGATQGGFRGKVPSGTSNTGGYGGGGGAGNHPGGFCGNGTHDAAITNLNNFGMQGAHILIISTTITNFNIYAIHTGGSGYVAQHYGGAGYGGGGAGNGGGGGYRGGGGGDFGSGGSAGYAFIYCNTFKNPIPDGFLLTE